MDIISLLLGLALLVIVAALVLRPFLQPGKTQQLPTPEIDTLVLRHEAIVTALRDLDFDHATDKLPEPDYLAQRETLMAEGVVILKQLDRLGVRTPAKASPSATPSASIDAAIEQALAARKQAQQRFCHQCGTPVEATDKFCANCGAALSQRQP